MCDSVVGCCSGTNAQFGGNGHLLIPVDSNFTVTNHYDCAVIWYSYDLETMAFMFFDMLWRWNGNVGINWLKPQ